MGHNFIWPQNPNKSANNLPIDLWVFEVTASESKEVLAPFGGSSPKAGVNLIVGCSIMWPTVYVVVLIGRRDDTIIE